MLDSQIMVLSVMAEDRPGIVAEITAGIDALGGNLADLRQSVLCGYFTMILVVEFSKSQSVEDVQQSLTKSASAQVSVMPYEQGLDATVSGENTYVLSAVGQDRGGLVAQISRFCVDHGINILDLTSHVDGDQYTMMLQIDIEGLASFEAFQAALVPFGESSGLKLVLQHYDIFKATNEI